MYAVTLIRQCSIQKTSSGKIQRNACRRAFVSRELEIEGEWRETGGASVERIDDGENAPSARRKVHSVETPEGWLQGKLAALLRVAPAEIDIDQPITRYGLDSLM